MAAHYAPLSLGFSRQGYWSGVPFPSSMHESEKRKWSLSVVPTLSDPMDCSLPGSSVHGTFQARVLEWGAIAAAIFSPKQKKDVGWGASCEWLPGKHSKEGYSCYVDLLVLSPLIGFRDLIIHLFLFLGFPGGSASEKSTCGHTCFLQWPTLSLWSVLLSVSE